MRTVGSGRVGFDCARGFEPDTVIGDVFLRDTDGLRALRAARSGVFFVMLTAGCGNGESEQTLRREADLSLDEPIDLSRFHAELRRTRIGAREINAFN